MRPNENKMSDGGRERASLGVKEWKSSQKWSVQRSAVRSIVWLDVWRRFGNLLCIRDTIGKRSIWIKSLARNRSPVQVPSFGSVAAGANFLDTEKPADQTVIYRITLA